jgi:hypothetical protein
MSFLPKKKKLIVFLDFDVKRLARQIFARQLQGIEFQKPDRLKFKFLKNVSFLNVVAKTVFNLGNHGCQIYLGTTYQRGKNTKITTNIYIPNGRKIDQIALGTLPGVRNSCH